MEIKKNLNGNKLVVELTGRLDTNTAPELEKVINELPEEVTELVFDIQGLEYLSSAGLRVLLAAQKIMLKKGTMVIKNPNEVVMEVFDMTGFSSILTIE